MAACSLGAPVQHLHYSSSSSSSSSAATSSSSVALSLPRLSRLPCLHLSPPVPTFKPTLNFSTSLMCARDGIHVLITDEKEEKEEIRGSFNGARLPDEARGEDEQEVNRGARTWDASAIASARETYGEVSKIIASRAIDHKMFYLIEWKDGHEPSWLPASSIAKDVVAEYEGPWWKAARSADEGKLRELLADEGRDVDTVDDNGRTALQFASGMGSEPCVRLLVEAGADVDGQDPDGLSPLHMATGYARQNAVTALLELGADPEIPDSKGRTPIDLAQELTERMPKANPLQFARRLGLENILKLLESEVYENAEVEQVLDRRSTSKGDVEYLVKWKDGSENEWVPAGSVADDLIKDYEAGLEYGIAEEILEKREENGQVEYLVRWADTEKPTWEPFQNVAAELVADFEKISVAEVERMQEKNVMT